MRIYGVEFHRFRLPVLAGVEAQASHPRAVPGLTTNEMTTRADRITGPVPLPPACPRCDQPLRYYARSIENHLIYRCVRDGWFVLDSEGMRHVPIARPPFARPKSCDIKKGPAIR